jgi:uncharacterized protein (TIGR00725 family)
VGETLRDARLVSVAGPGRADPIAEARAEEIGARLVDAGFWVVTGGLGGVMEAASRGAKSRRGSTIGVLPGTDPAAANGWVDLALPTGLGELRNALVARLGLALVAVGDGCGTLTEVGFALGLGRPVVGVGTWAVHGVEAVDTPQAAVERVVRLLSQ